ncbi:MAG: hypothetical protein HY849_08665 [Nitrosomonadales bacterium]|nr:hypothetical protein [Nitrosomonadales bacterium]
MDGSTVLAKTPKGLEEMEKRTYRLPPRLRQILILVDGKRNLATLAEMLASPEVGITLAQLVADGFLAEAAAPAAPVAAKPTAAKSNGEQDIPTDPAERLSMARNFIINTTQTFVGMFGSGLIARAKSAQNVEDLRQLVKDWDEAIASTAGKKRSAELKPRLLALLE